MATLKKVYRKRLIEDLISEIEIGTSRNIFGLPRSGKKWLVDDVCQRFLDGAKTRGGNSRRVITVSVSQTDSPVGFWQDLWHKTIKDLSSSKKCGQAVEATGEAWRRPATTIANFLDKGQDRFVLLVVKDFHQVEDFGEEGRRVLVGFKELIDSFSSESGFACLFISRKPIRCIQPGTKPYDELADVVSDYPISVFRPDDVVELANGDKSLGRAVYNRTGGLPQLTCVMLKKALLLNLHADKLKEIESAARVEIENSLRGLKAGLSAIRIYGSPGELDLFTALVDRESRSRGMISPIALDVLGYAGLGIEHLPEEMSLLAEFLQRESYGVMPVENGSCLKRNLAAGSFCDESSLVGIGENFTARDKPKILVDLDNQKVRINGGEGIRMTGQGYCLVLVLTLNGFGNDSPPALWDRRIETIREELKDRNKCPPWLKVSKDTTASEVFRQLRKKLTAPLNAACGRSDVQIVPVMATGKYKIEKDLPANVLDWFAVTWWYKGADRNDFPYAEFPEELRPLLGP